MTTLSLTVFPTAHHKCERNQSNRGLTKHWMSAWFKGKSFVLFKQSGYEGINQESVESQRKIKEATKKAKDYLSTETGVTMIIMEYC